VSPARIAGKADAQATTVSATAANVVVSRRAAGGLAVMADMSFLELRCASWRE
jgi:hypothetical protein